MKKSFIALTLLLCAQAAVSKNYPTHKIYLGEEHVVAPKIVVPEESRLIYTSYESDGTLPKDIRYVAGDRPGGWAWADDPETAEVCVYTFASGNPDIIVNIESREVRDREGVVHMEYYGTLKCIFSIKVKEEWKHYGQNRTYDSDCTTTIETMAFKSAEEASEYVKKNMWPLTDKLYAAIKNPKETNWNDYAFSVGKKQFEGIGEGPKPNSNYCYLLNTLNDSIRYFCIDAFDEINDSVRNRADTLLQRIDRRFNMYPDTKEYHKVKYGMRLNKMYILYILERFDESEAIANELIEMKYEKSDCKRLLSLIKEAREDLKRTGYNTRHYPVNCPPDIHPSQFKNIGKPSNRSNAVYNRFSAK